jgi:hypothetical protein
MVWVSSVLFVGADADSGVSQVLSPCLGYEYLMGIVSVMVLRLSSLLVQYYDTTLILSSVPSHFFHTVHTSFISHPFLCHVYLRMAAFPSLISDKRELY